MEGGVRLARHTDPGISHLFVISSIPVVHPDFSELERALSIFPGQQELEDGLRDRWNSTPHKQEAAAPDPSSCWIFKWRGNRVTLLSGDVHVGALGLIRDLRSIGGGASEEILQLTSSGIISPPPKGRHCCFWRTS